jgi:hypothetical protein
LGRIRKVFLLWNTEWSPMIFADTRLFSLSFCCSLQADKIRVSFGGVVAGCGSAAMCLLAPSQLFHGL